VRAVQPVRVRDDKQIFQNQIFEEMNKTKQQQFVDLGAGWGEDMFEFSSFR
jgi:hypothetical protein